MNEKQATVTTDEYFGGCPECGRTNGYLNIGRNHWLVCDEHRTKWLVGSNLFSCWREEDETIWRQNWERLQPYREVEPVRPVREKPAAVLDLVECDDALPF